MIRIWKYSLIVLLAALAACTRFEFSELTGEAPDVPEGYEHIEFTVGSSAMDEVATRVVDIDGGGITDMRLFCFDRYGLFIVSSVATVKPTSSTTGEFEAIIPVSTRIVHFISNQNMTNYPEDQFHGKTELEVLGLLEGSSGKMIYWSRVEAPSTTDADGYYTVSFKEHLEKLNYTTNGRTADVWMIRNHAMVQISNENNDEHFETTGLALYNTMAFGTVAPLTPNNTFPEVWPDNSSDYVTLPSNKTRLTDQVAVQGATVLSNGSTVFGQYVYECENTQDNPVSVILRGKNKSGTTAGQELYYRVMLQQQNSDKMINLRRNHRYIINVTGPLNYGQATFEDAVKAPATNNIWVSISDDIREVQNKTDILTVEKTAYVEEAPAAASKSMYIYYNLEKVGSGALVTKPDLDWIGDQNVSENLNFDAAGVHEYGVNEYTVDGETYNGRITLTLSQMAGLDKREGTLLIKSGQLQRKVKVITIAEQTFEPAWASSQVYGVVLEDGGVAENSKGTRPHATLMFTIPENTPAELFPMKVLIGATKLDVRSASGQTLPVVSRGQADFGDEISYSYTAIEKDANDKETEVTVNVDINHKYVLEVKEPGVQRVYFESILNEGADDFDRVYIEADHFATIYKEVKFSTKKLSINALDMAYYSVKEGSDDENIKFLLVPQKVNAPISLSLVFREGRTVEGAATVENTEPNTNKNPNTQATVPDELLLYSQHLDAPNNYPSVEPGFTDINSTDVYIKESRRNFWTTNGRLHLFWARSWTSDYVFKLNLFTNSAKSAEPVRIASNESGHSYIGLDADAVESTDGGPYYGRSFRTFIFELANYHPFRFAAKVQFDGGEYQGTTKMYDPEKKQEATDIKEHYLEVTDNIEFPYDAVGAKVNLAIDITSFHSNPQEGASQAATKLASVDPFGTPFDIYIDAPMLSLDSEDQLVKDKKLEADPNVRGRFIYHVDGNRETEREYGRMGAEIKDNGQINWTEGGKVNAASYTPDQTKERKVLPFLTNTIVSSGNITISTKETDPDKITRVVFYDKSFNVRNTPEVGEIYYKDGTENKLIEAGQFVVVQRDYDHQRLATMAVTAPDASGNNYQLRLRKEYSFSWTDDIELQYTKDGSVYSYKMKLNELCATSKIVLAKTGTQSN